MSKARMVLGAVQLAASAEISKLRQLLAKQSGTLPAELILRILLTYLPESTEPDVYTGLVLGLKNEGLERFKADDEQELDSLPKISEHDARQQTRQLHLLPVLDPENPQDESADIFTQFLLHRSSRIDKETGSTSLIAQLIEPFIEDSEYLRTWAVATVLPLLRLNCEYYPEENPAYSLTEFERLNGAPAVQALLAKAAEHGSSINIARDIRGIVGPWVHGQSCNKRRKLDNMPQRGGLVTVETSNQDATITEDIRRSSWEEVNEWLLELASKDHKRAAGVFEQWEGPQDVDYGGWDTKAHKTAEADAGKNLTSRYAQAGMAMIYTAAAKAQDATEGSQRIIQRVAQLLDLPCPPDSNTLDNQNSIAISPDYIDTIFPSHLLNNTLLRPQNPLTSPTHHAISLAYCLSRSAQILEAHGDLKAERSLLDLAIFEGESEQLAELRRLLHGIQARTRDEQTWEEVRHQVLWLHQWKQRPPGQRRPAANCCGLFHKVSSETVEAELLKAMLANSCYNLATNIYCTEEPPLPRTMVRDTVIDVAFASYDSASNGNKTRGGVRKSAEIAKAFRESFPGSQQFKELNALIAATHAMSFYSLTLQHGVPFRPVNIRAHKDPMLLVGKILEQNARSYTKLDDLIDIGQNLVDAGLTPLSGNNDAQEKKDSRTYLQITAERRVISMAIEAALGERDFETAYSYVVNRLSPANQPSRSPANAFVDDIAWRAAYRAGCYKSPRYSGGSILRRLEQRIELLSQALFLAPSSSLAEILGVWRECEEELAKILTQEDEDEEKWNAKGDRHVPGGFTRDSVPTVQKSRQPTRAAMNEEAPMGLFDVARGAAAALSKNAFPLRSPGTRSEAGSLQTPHQRSLSMMGSGASDSGSGTENEGRIRKRDMVSNMVTGGLASGIGWVLGAPPVKNEE